MAPLVVVEDLRKTYPGTRKAPPVEAVRGISFTVEAGETFGLLGPNGAGKSTTLGCITSLVRPTAGRVLVEGVDARRDPSRVKRKIAVVPQTRNLDRDLSLRDILVYHARYFGLPAGYEMSTLVATVMDIGSNESMVPPEVAAELAKLASDVHIKVFVTPG